MKRIIGIPLSALLLAALVITGCHEITEVEESQVGKLEQALKDAPEVRALMQIRTELTLRIAQRKITSEQLRHAYATQDEQQFAALFGYSVQGLDQLQRQFNELWRNLLATYPQLRDKDAATGRPASDAERFYHYATRLVTCVEHAEGTAAHASLAAAEDDGEDTCDPSTQSCPAEDCDPNTQSCSPECVWEVSYFEDDCSGVDCARLECLYCAGELQYCDVYS